MSVGQGVAMQIIDNLYSSPLCYMCSNRHEVLAIIFLYITCYTYFTLFLPDTCAGPIAAAVVVPSMVIILVAIVIVIIGVIIFWNKYKSKCSCMIAIIGKAMPIMFNPLFSGPN